MASCSFPFVLSGFAPAAVPPVLPFWIFPLGATLDFRFLSSTSVLASHYSAFCSSFSTFLPVSASQLASSVLLLSFRSSGLFPFFPAWFPVPSFRFCVLGFPFVSFRSSQLRSHGCSAGAHLMLCFVSSALLSVISPSFLLPFVRFFSGSHYLALAFFFSLLPYFPLPWVFQVLPYPLSLPPVAMLPFLLWYSALLLFFSTVFCFALQPLLQFVSFAFQL